MFSPCERVCVSSRQTVVTYTGERHTTDAVLSTLAGVCASVCVCGQIFHRDSITTAIFSHETSREWARSKWTLCFKDEHGVSNQARREWHGPTTCIRGCADIYFSRNDHRSPLEHFRIMRPATLWQLQIPSKSSRCGSGLQIPQIPVWLSILWTCQNKPDLMRTHCGCPGSSFADMDTGPLWAPCGILQCPSSLVSCEVDQPCSNDYDKSNSFMTNYACDMEKVGDLLNVWMTCQCSCMWALHLLTIYFNTVCTSVWRKWHIKWFLKPISGCGSGL